MEKVFIFSGGVARQLIQKGYIVIDIAENQKYEGKTVFIFEKSDELIKVLKERFNIDVN